jgi:hypothetical protein
MTALVSMRIVATAQIKNLLRRTHRGSPMGWVDERVVGLVAAGALVVLAGVGTVQSARVGARMGSTFGPGPIATTMSFTGALTAVTAIIAASIWRRQVREEAARLGVLPLGSRAVRVLSLVPALLPVSLGVLVSAPVLVAFAVMSGTGVITLVTGVALGACLTLIVHAVWVGVVGLVRPRADRAPALLTAITLVMFLAHAVWTATRRDGQDRWDAVANPVVWVLKRETAYSPLAMAAATAILVTALVLMAWVARAASRRRDGARAAADAGPHHATDRIVLVPLGLRTPAWMIRLIWRQSAVASEIGTGAILGLLLAFLSSLLLAQGRAEHAAVGLFAMAGFCALPLMGVRSTLGSVPRLTSLGAGLADIRLGLIAAGVVFYLAAATPGVLLLILRDAPPASVAKLLLYGAVIFGPAMAIGSMMRTMTMHSLGRSAAVIATMLLLVGGFRAGVAQWSLPALAASAVVSGSVLAVVLWRTVTHRTVT